MKAKITSIVLALLVGFILVACGPSQAELGAQATEVAANQAATQTAAAPTNTPVPPTATPTSTPVPPTETPTPTNTPIPPTDTPIPPTATPSPTPILPTNTPVPPTATPTPPTDTPTPAPPPPTPTPAVEAQFQQGVAYFEQGQWEQAVAAFQAVLQANPGFAVAYRYLGYSYANQNAYEPAIKSLEQYLQLAPDANDRAEVEGDLTYFRLAGTIPPGKALFFFTNFTSIDWSIDVGPHRIDLPPWNGGEYPVGTAVLDPGTYIWQGHSVGGGYYIRDIDNNRHFEFAVEAGEIHAESVR